MPVKLSDQYIKSEILGAGEFPPEREYEVRDSVQTGLALIVRTSGNLTFCLRYRNAAGVARKYTLGAYGKITTSQARDIAKKMLGKIAGGDDIQTERREKRAQADRERRSTVRFFLENKYQDWILTERKSGAMILRRLKGNFGDWYDRSMSDITPWLVTSWRSKRLKEGIKPSTVNRDITSLKAMLAKAVEWGDLPMNPLAPLKPLRVDNSSVIRYLTEAEEKRLRSALLKRQEGQVEERERYNGWRKQRHQEPLEDLSEFLYTDYLMPMVLVDLNTGLRRGEIFNVRLADIDFSQRILAVRGEGTKSGHTRHIPLNNEAFSVLTAWCNQEGLTPQDLVFASPVTGGRFDNISTAWAGLVKLARLEKFRFHDLRHTFASKLVMRGVDLYTVKELLGHQNIETTQRYAHLAPEHKAKAVELLDER